MPPQPLDGPRTGGGSPPDRYWLRSFHARSLEGNPLGAPVEREVRVYLPPGYHESDERYPVVYFLHGYGGDARHAIVTAREEFLDAYPAAAGWFVSAVLKAAVTCERLDRLVRSGGLPPFILVQPDGSLHLPQIHGGVHPSSARAAEPLPRLKGSMYYDSPGTGRYGSYVFGDLVDWVDREYRTVADRSHRYLAGGSMGGYGALLGGIFHPDRFSRVAALSPSVCGLDVVDLELFIPFVALALGRERARREGRNTVEDILDTCDLVFAPDRPLVPTIRRDETGRAVEMDEAARAKWAAADAGRLAVTTDGAFRDVALRVSCEEHDEFGFAGPDRRLHEQLEEHAIEHTYVPFSDLRARALSGHSLGIGLQIEPALRFLLAGACAGASP
ncbi:MAG: alpha/beta hydrolase [Spirochaetota bacterium]